MKRNVMMPFEPTHPGSVIRDELEARNITQKQLAQDIGVLPTFLNEIIKGKRPITADFALLLEKSLEIPAELWMKFQSQYQIRCSQKQRKKYPKNKTY